MFCFTKSLNKSNGMTAEIRKKKNYFNLINIVMPTILFEFILMKNSDM